MKLIDDTEYFMEDRREKNRLVDKVDPEEWFKAYVEQWIRPASDVLDVGCGPGVLARAVAPNVRSITALELSEDRYTEATHNLVGVANAEVVRGSAVDMPFEDDQFDFACTRFMLEYLRKPEQAVSEMLRVCRPGGRVMLQDLDGQLVWHYPIKKSLEDGINCVVKALAATGFDPFIGRKLFHLAKMAGLKDIVIRCEPYHLVAGEIDQRNYNLWNLKLEIAFPAIAEAVGGQEEARKLIQQFMEQLCREDTLTYSNVFTIVGTKPARTNSG